MNERRLPRMTTRRWMIAIAMGALLLAGEIAIKRRAEYLRLAGLHAHEEACCRLGLIECVRYIEEGERLGERMSIHADPATLALEPLHRLLDSKSDYEAYERVMNLPFRRSALDNWITRIAYHVALRRKYEVASKRPWLSVEPGPAVLAID